MRLWSLENVACLAAIVIALAPASAMAGPGLVTITPRPDRFCVSIDGQLFTEYIYRGYPRPILYPVIGPYGIGITRNWPLKDNVPGYQPLRNDPGATAVTPNSP